MAYYKSLRDFIDKAEEAGLLYRYKDPIDKETELIPFHRVQMRGLADEDRKTLLFEKPVSAKGRTYDMSVLVGCYASSERILTLAMGCSTYDEAIERFHQGLAHPIAPKIVESGPVHEEVHTGPELAELGLDEIPVPVEEVGFSGMIRTGLPVLSKDPDTGNINLGTYNGFFRAQDRICLGVGFGRVLMDEHWRKAQERGEDLPVAILVGAVPAIMATSSCEIPYGQPGLDEYSVAGGIAGEPIELVRCKTVPLEVPATCELVIEGYVSKDLLEPRLPFGEYPGYLNADMNVRPVMRVTAITHRTGAMFTPVIVGMYPSDCNVVWSYAHNALMYHHLKYEKGFPVEEVYFPQEAGAAMMCLIRVADGTPQSTVEEIMTAAARRRGAKYIVALDYDIPLRQQETVIWAINTRTQPMDDVRVEVAGGIRGGLDPSGAPAGIPSARHMLTTRGDGPNSVTLINATRKHPFPPVALPARQYMERAVDLWTKRGDLPTPHMRTPWYGYTLGYWPEELEEYAEMIAKGEYLEVGKMVEEQQSTYTAEQLEPRGSRIS